MTGRVQGVGFRFTTAERAAQLGVTGWVRNLPDRSVEVEVQGVEQLVDALVSWLEIGPRHATVDCVETTDVNLVDDERRFRVVG